MHQYYVDSTHAAAIYVTVTLIVNCNIHIMVKTKEGNLVK